MNVSQMGNYELFSVRGEIKRTLENKYGDRMPEIDEILFEVSAYSKTHIGVVFLKNEWRVPFAGNHKTEIIESAIKQMGEYIRMPRMDKIMREREARRLMEVSRE